MDQIIIRELWTCEGIGAEYVRNELNFPSVLQVYYLRKQTYLNGKIKHQEHSYGITSHSKKDLSPSALLDAMRKHWEVENGLHHVKDRSWLEDHQYTSSREKGRILGVLRNLSLNILRVLLPPNPDRKKRKHQKSLPLQAIGHIANPVRTLNKLAGV